jgi:hypothetical protein
VVVLGAINTRLLLMRRRRRVANLSLCSQLWSDFASCEDEAGMRAVGGGGVDSIGDNRAAIAGTMDT